MKILHVIHSVDPIGGGPIEGVKQFTAAHRRLGHDVEVVSVDAPDAPCVRSFPFPLHALGPASPGYGYTPRLVPWLRAHAPEFDFAIGHGLWQYGNLALWRSLRSSSTPYGIFPHGMLDPWFKRQYPLKHLKKWLYWLWAEYRVLRDARAVFFTCEEERRLARQSFWLYRCHEEVVGFAAAAPPPGADGARETFLARWPELRGQRLLLFLGRVHEKKGCLELVESLPTGPFHLVFAGPAEGDYARRVRARVQKLGLEARVTWTGLIEGDLKWGAFHAAEAFVLPSHQENFGVAVAEALACGLPVLISDKVNIWRDIQDDGAGLVEPDGVEGTTRLLQRWAALPEDQRAAMRQAASACFQRRFEVTQVAERLTATLSRLLPTAR